MYSSKLPSPSSTPLALCSLRTKLYHDVCCRRGKHDQKHYTVYLAAVTPEAKAAYKPKLNEEHSAWQWIPLKVRHALCRCCHPCILSPMR
jgi:hypothetical protein